MCYIFINSKEKLLEKAKKVNVKRTSSARVKSNVKSPVAAVHQAVVESFATHKTLSYEYRIEQLKALQKGLKAYQDEIISAVRKDLGRSEYEASFELAAHAEIRYFLDNLRSLMFTKTLKLICTVWGGG